MLSVDELADEIERGRAYKISTVSQLIDHMTDGVRQCLELGFRQEVPNERRETWHMRIRFYNDVVRYVNGLEVYGDRKIIERFLDGIGYGRHDPTI